MMGENSVSQGSLLSYNDCYDRIEFEIFGQGWHYRSRVSS